MRVIGPLVVFLSLSSGVSAEAGKLLFPQIAAGGTTAGLSSQTLLFINNTSATNARVQADLFATGGQALALKFNGQLQTSFERTLNSGETALISITSDSAVGLPGWLQLTAPPGVGASVVIQLLYHGGLVSEVGVLASSPRVSGTILVQKGSPVGTGFAIANPNEQEATVVLSLFDSSGFQLAEKTIVMSPRDHLARFVDEVFQMNAGEAFLGSVGVISDLPVAVISLRLSELKLSSVPVLDGHVVGGAVGRLIVFVRNDDIALYDLERREEMQLPGLNTVDLREDSPAITPDGRFIAFKSSPKNLASGDLFLYDRTTSSRVALSTINKFALPGVDPDRGNLTLSDKGRFLLFDMTRRSTHPGAPAIKGAVILFDLLTGRFVPLPRITDFSKAADTWAADDDLLTPSLNHTPFLSHDGRLVAFSTQTRTGSDIFLLDRGTDRLIALPGLNLSWAQDTQPSLSADHRFLVFVSNRKDPSQYVFTQKSDIFLYDLERSKLVDLPNLNDENAIDGHPSISSDGRFIVFHSNRNGNFDLFLYDRENSSLRPLAVNTNAWESQPRITP